MKNQAGYIRTNDGVRIYCEEAGIGKDMLFLHGHGCSLVWWKRNFPILAEQFHVVAMDFRGCGRSEKATWGHSIARYAMDAHNVIHALGLHDLTLVGWSLGGRTGYGYLELFGPHRLRGVVIVDDTVHPDIHLPAPAAARQQPGESDEDYARRSTRQMMMPEDPDALPEEELEWMLAASGLIPEGEAISTDGQKDWRPLCPVIDLPVLLTSGRHSGALPGCEYAAEHIPGARLEVFEHSGHGLFWTEADRFNQVVADFVNRAGLPDR